LEVAGTSQEVRRRQALTLGVSEVPTEVQVIGLEIERTVNNLIACLIKPVSTAIVTTGLAKSYVQFLAG
jgi:hypothetical protein